MPSFNYRLVASILHDEKALSRALAPYLAALERIGGKRAQSSSEVTPFIFVATGGTEGRVLTHWLQQRSEYAHLPVFLIAHPGHNSLPAALEIRAYLLQQGVPGRIYYLASPDDVAGLKAIIEGAQMVKAWSALQQSRIGLVGNPSDWLIASRPRPIAVHQTWGTEVVPVALDRIYKRMQRINSEETYAAVEELVAQADETVEPSREDLEQVVKVYLALQEIVRRERLEALSLRCFDLVLKLKTTGCYALSRLLDEGIIAGCEGDIVSTLGMLWAYLYLERLPWMGNPARLDVANNRLWMAHCTVPRRLTEGYRIRSHFESGLGVGIQGEMKRGEVTLFRLGGEELRQFWVAEGEIVQTGREEDLCRTQVEIALTRGRVEELLEHPLGNHLVLVHGHHAERLLTWWRTFIARDGQG